MKPELKQTKDYSMFSVDAANRSVENFTKIKASLQKFGFLPSHPLHVVRRSRKLIIIDGQHRFTAARALGIPVYYVVCPDSAISIPQINDAQKAWAAKDYIKSYSAQGSDDYRLLMKFIADTQLPVVMAVTLLSGNLGRNGKSSSKVKSGDFKVVSTDAAYKVARIAIAASKHVKWSRNTLFIDAIARCVGLQEFSPEHFIKKMNAMPGNLKLQPTRATFLQMIEDVYNYKSRQQVHLKYLAEKAAIERNPAKKG